MHETLLYKHFQINHKETIDENIHLLEFVNNQVIKNACCNCIIDIK